MKGRWRFVLGLACCVLLGVKGGESTGTRPSLPPEVAELLPHAVVLWEEQVITEFTGYFEVDFVAARDFTADAIPDLLISQHTTLFLLQGRAEGGFEEPWVAAFYPLEEPPLRFGVLAALTQDLNADGLPDLIVSTIADEAHGAVFVFENQGRRFRPTGMHRLDAPTDWMALVDVTTDGKEDLILSQFDRKHGITRIFALPRVADFAWGEPIVVGEGRGWPTALADLDGDGHRDLVLIHFDLTLWPDTGYVRVLWGHFAGFQGETVFRPAQALAKHAAAGDLNGDGQAELVVTTIRKVVVVHIRGRECAEGYAFDPGFSAERAWLADMDGDRHLDVLVSAAYRRSVGVWAGDGQGGFKGRATEYAPEPQWIKSLHVVDVHGDGFPDLVLNYPSHLALVRNGGSPRGTSMLPTSGIHLLAVGDLSRNGAPDMIMRVKDGVEVLWNNGKGGLVRAPLLKGKAAPVAAAVAHGRLYTLDQLALAHTGYVEYVIRAYSSLGDPLGTWELGEDCVPLLFPADLDGDGVKELVGARQQRGVGEVWVLWDDGELTTHSLPAQSALLAVADLDGDGKDEVGAVCIADYADLRIVSFVGRRARVSDPVLQLPAQPMAVATGDLDGDSLSDPVFIGFTVEVFPGPPVGFAPRTVVLGMWLSSQGEAYTLELDVAQGQLPWPFHGLVLGDFTGDGIADLVFTTLEASGAVLLTGQGRGAFGEPQFLPTPLGPIAAADLDGNGQPELVGSTQGVNPYLWILWNGGGGR